MSLAPLQPLRRWPAQIDRFAVFGAWFFIVFSLMHLAWVLAVKWPNPQGLVTLYQSTVGEHTHRAWGLAYPGVPGLLLAILQMAAVLAAAVASTLSARRAARLGHLVLIVWAAVWMIGLARLARLDHQIDSFVQTAFASLLFGCTLYRAARPRRRALPPSDACGGHAEHVEDIVTPVDPPEHADTDREHHDEHETWQDRLGRLAATVLLLVTTRIRPWMARTTREARARARPVVTTFVRSTRTRLEPVVHPLRSRLAGFGRRAAEQLARLETPASTKTR